jgi:hypothetical protein
MMRDVIDSDACLPRGTHKGAEIVERSHFLRYVLNPWPELTSLAQEVVVKVDT